MSPQHHRTALLLSLAIVCLVLAAFPAGPAGADPIGLKAFLAEVAAANLDYAAARYNVSIAEAQLVAARVAPNPTFTTGTSGRDLSDHGAAREPANNAFSVAETFELGGKRAKRVTAARANLAEAASTLDDFFRNLRGTAAVAFVDALTKRRIVAEKKHSADALDQLVDANRRRLEVGDIGEIDLTQSRVDALQFHADSMASESSAQVAELGLEQLAGNRLTSGKTPGLSAAGDLAGAARSFDAASLADSVALQRPDIVAARHAVEAARANVKVAEALVFPDPSLSFTYQDNQRSHNEIAPAPSYVSAGLAVSVALPVFNSYRGEREVAHQTLAQAEVNLRSIELRAQVEVREALARYRLASARAAQFDGGALDDAAAVLKAKLFSYEHGAADFFSTCSTPNGRKNDVRLAYLDALDERAKALIGLEVAAGIWDIDF